MNNRATTHLFDLSTMSDIAANMFAALIMVLLIVSAAQLSRPTPQPDVVQQDSPIEADQAFQVEPHIPLSSTDMVEMLRARLLNASTISLDIFEDHVDLTTPQSPTMRFSVPSAELEAQLRMLPANWPVRLYLFDQTLYTPLYALLARAGRSSPLEFAVPAALRTDEKNAWLPDFIALNQNAQNAREFRMQLAQLLAHSQQLAEEKRKGTGGRGAKWSTFSSPFGDLSYPDLFANFMAVIRQSLNVLALLVGLGLIWHAHRIGRV